MCKGFRAEINIEFKRFDIDIGEFNIWVDLHQVPNIPRSNMIVTACQYTGEEIANREDCIIRMNFTGPISHIMSSHPISRMRFTSNPLPPYAPHLEENPPPDREINPQSEIKWYKWYIYELCKVSVRRTINFTTYHSVYFDCSSLSGDVINIYGLYQYPALYDNGLLLLDIPDG